MKKFFGVMLLGVLALTGCMESDDANYKDYQKIAPGLEMYVAANVQMNVSMQPANAAMRLGILLAEVDKQVAAGEEVDYQTVAWQGRNVKTTLLGAATTITKDAAGNYTVTYPVRTQLFGYYFEGPLVVRTGNRALSETSRETPWTVGTEGFRVLESSGSGTAAAFNGGETRIYANGDGTYTVELSAMNIGVSGQNGINSNWGGAYRVKPEGGKLAYSDCGNKKFEVTGTFAGATFHSLMRNNAATAGTRMSWTLSDGLYQYAGSTLTGTIEVRFIGSGDYDATYYVAPDVKVVWSLDGNVLSRMIYYNGFSRLN